MADWTALLDTQRLLPVLQQHFTDPVRDLAPLQAGHVSRAFAFRAREVGYIARFNSLAVLPLFRKDAYAWRHIASTRIPIPAVLHVGEAGELAYAISHRAPGRTLDLLPADEYAATVPSALETLAAIHAVDVAGTTGYGDFDGSGAGQFASWRDFLTRIAVEEAPDGYFGRWHRLFTESFLERDAFDRIYARLLSLLDYCPERRWLVHGDYGGDNVLADGGRVTAVIDWANAKYGDFVFDIAWVNFWPFGHDFPALCRRYYADRGVSLPDYDERVMCYTCYVGLDALRFFAQGGDRAAYVWARDRMLAILDRADATPGATSTNSGRATCYLAS